MPALKAMEGVRRQEMYRIPASLIKVVEEDNTRTVQPSRQYLEGLKRSISEHGQLNPCIVFKLPDGYKLSAGYNRYKAIVSLNEGKPPEDQIPVLCYVRTGNDQDAFLTSLEENLHRADLTPIDKALAMKKLKEVYGWTDDQVGEEFGMKRSSVWQYLTLLTLENEYQRMLIDGRMRLTTAFEVARMPDAEARKKAVEESQDESGKVDRQKLIKVSRDMQATRAARGRSVKEIREEIETWIGSPPDAVKYTTQYIGKSIVEFSKGRINADTLLGRIERVTAKDLPKDVKWRPKVDEESDNGE